MFGLSQHLLMKAGHLTSLTKTEAIIDLGTRTCHNGSGVNLKGVDVHIPKCIACKFCARSVRFACDVGTSYFLISVTILLG